MSWHARFTVWCAAISAAFFLWLLPLAALTHNAATAPARAIAEAANLQRRRAEVQERKRLEAEAYEKTEAERQKALAEWRQNEMERRASELAEQREEAARSGRWRPGSGPPAPLQVTPGPPPKRDRSSAPLRCCDGTDSPSCTCGGPRRGCCSHHKGVCGCSDDP
jgi:hypothetical protein